MKKALFQLDRLLRGETTRPETIRDGQIEVAIGGLAILIVALGMIYGLCMGSYSALRAPAAVDAASGGRYMQLFASMVKVPALFYLTLLVTFPSLYVFNALVGSRLTMTSVLRLLIASLGVNLAVLASLGPIMLFFSASTKSYAFILLLNVVVFAVAGFLGLTFLLQTLHRLTAGDAAWERGERFGRMLNAESAEAAPPKAAGEDGWNVPLKPVGEEPPREDPSALELPPGQALGQHTQLVFGCWVVVFALVGAQMGWVLRPFVGNPGMPFSWFRERESNFFEGVLNALRTLFSGGWVMRAWLMPADDVLRRAPWITSTNETRRALFRLACCILAFALVYGAMMGTYRGIAGQSEWFRQILYSAVKVPILLSVTFAISLPSFFVLNSLFGLRRDFGQAIRALVAAQAGLAIVLASLGPITLFWYASSPNYQHALIFNGLMFLVASIAAQWHVRRLYRPLVERNRRHRQMLWTWLLVYMAVAIQLAWVMRPFVGSPASAVRFFRENAWDNAYVFVIQLVWRTVFP